METLLELVDRVVDADDEPEAPHDPQCPCDDCEDAAELARDEDEHLRISDGEDA